MKSVADIFQQRVLRKRMELKEAKIVTSMDIVSEVYLNKYIKAGANLKKTTSKIYPRTGKDYKPHPEAKDTKISSLGKHDIYMRTQSGEYNHYFAHNTETGKVDVALSTDERKHKKEGNSTMKIQALTSHPDSELKVHKFYHHLITKHNKILTSDHQSEGGMKVWQKLANERGINIHAFLKGQGRTVNPHDDNETHATHPERHAAPKTYNQALVASRGRRFKDDRTDDEA